MRITGDNDIGKRELDNFINPEEPYPVIATTSELMTTGIDAQTVKVIVLDTNINSMTKFKQIIGRGTRINEDLRQASISRSLISEMQPTSLRIKILTATRFASSLLRKMKI